MQDQTELLATLERSTRTGVHVIGLRVATYAIGFAGSILIARAVGPEGRGRYVLPLAVLAIVFTIGNLGLEHAQIYLAGRKVPLTALWANATFIGVVAALVVWALAALVLLSPAGAAADSPVTWLLVALVQLPLMLHILYWLNILQLAGRVRAGVAASAVAAAVQTVAVVALFVTHGLTPFRVLVLTAITTAITWLVVLAIGWRSGLVSLRVDRAHLRTGLRFGLKAQLGIVFVFLLLRVDQVMVQRILGFEALGLVLARGHARGAALAPVRPVRGGAPALSGARRRGRRRAPRVRDRTCLASACSRCCRDGVGREPLAHPPRLRRGVRRRGLAVPAAAAGHRGARDPASARRGALEARPPGSGELLRRRRPRAQRGAEPLVALAGSAW